MNEHQFELTWAGKEPASRLTPRVLIRDAATAAADAFSSLRWIAGLTVCGKVTCDCCSVLFWLKPVLPDGSLGEMDLIPGFWLDVWDHSLISDPELEKDADTLRLATGLVAALSEAEWDQLFQWFLAEKLEVIQTTPVEKIETGDLPDIAGGQMVGFVEIFPWGMSLEFSCRGRLYVVDDQYCVQPKCDCTETVLSFLSYKDASRKRTTGPLSSPAVRYNYRTRTARAELSGEPGQASTSELLDALKAAHPTFPRQLKQRHEILQSLYARAAKEGSRSGSVNAPRIAPPKVGRNDPCPCGSGKKYKHCCLSGSKPA